ncbi:MAG: hypothetical protein GXO74_15510 [Calditrichaeota bacterium]|nr:hypothetical protein [Calditrichota bacterium]
MTFWFLYLIRDEQNRLDWASYVAMLTAIFSFFVLSVEWHSPVADILLPVSIILGGVFLIFVRK